jgi:hypothetical protein
MGYLRIIFTILSAICIAGLIPLGMFFGWQGVGYCFFGALLFFVLMLFCKQSQTLKSLREGTNEHNNENANPNETKEETPQNTLENIEK